MKKIIIGLVLLMGIILPGSAEVSNQEIKALYAENSIKDAFNLLLSIPEEERSSENWLLMGNILQDEGKVDDAIFMYNNAIATDEKNYKAHYNLGNIFLEQDKPNLAIAEFKKTSSSYALIRSCFSVFASFFDVTILSKNGAQDISTQIFKGSMHFPF